MEAAGSRPRVALVAGASGLTGGALLKLLLRDDTFSRVIALSRRPLPVEHARFANRIPAKAIPEAKFPEECAATGRSPMRFRLLAIQFKAPNNLKEPTGVQP